MTTATPTGPVVIDDQGWIDLAFASGATARLDAFEAFNSYVELQAEHANKVELGAAWVDWLAGKGLPAVSHGAAFQVADVVIARVESLRQRDAGAVGVATPPAPTAAPSSAD